MRAIFTAETGHSKGAQAIRSPREAPVIPQKPSSFVPSDENTVAITCVSFMIHFGNIGLIGLSIILAVRVADSLGLHSLFINLFPPIFPVA